MGGLCVRLAGAAVGLVLTCASAFAQSPADASASSQHEHDAVQTADARAVHDMSAMAREGSGTSWLPDSSPMYMLHRQNGPWMLMAHENAFLQYLDESGDRGASQTGSINWLMGMAERAAGRGHLALRGMISLEPWTIRGCGYPDLLASGEVCGGEKIHDRQHPHDLFMEISAEYDAPLAGSTRWQLYGGPAAEPALGPVAYPHRVSAMPNPIAPIAHHWFDSTHVSFGVITGGVYGRRWKAETSAFNGREPDENRKDIDFGALDSVAGRVWFLPTANLALQLSAGRLKEAEAGEGIEPRRDVTRVTASATYNRVSGGNVWATTVGWGRNAELNRATHAVLAESVVTRADRDTWFGRLEIGSKTAHDLDIPSPLACIACIDPRTFAVTKLQGGYARYLTAGAFKPGVGVVVSAGFVPESLRAVYGSTVNTGIGVFLTLRPAMLVGASGGASTMVMVQTAYDPAKLTCPAGFDPTTAVMTTYEGKTYYFCSAADRDKFLIDPRMSLSMMPPKQ
jgi:YHS domain-containing protein